MFVEMYLHFPSPGNLSLFFEPISASYSMVFSQSEKYPFIYFIAAESTLRYNVCQFCVFPLNMIKNLKWKKINIFREHNIIGAYFPNIDRAFRVGMPRQVFPKQFCKPKLSSK
jgi:hypothetical protein